MTQINRDELGTVVREAWTTWAAEQPDVADHPSWTVPYDDLPERDREVDRLIGEAVAAHVRQVDAERRRQALANGRAVTTR